MALNRRDFVALGSAGLLLKTGSALADRSDAGKLRVMEGPMLGAVGADHLRVWLRTSQAVRVGVEVSTGSALENIVAHGESHTTLEEDCTTVVTVTGLQPATRYFYQVSIEGKPDPYLSRSAPMSVRTAPAPGGSDPFSVAFGSCARHAEDPIQPIWAHVRARSPDLFLWLGDNIYGDSLNPVALAEEYRRQRAVPAWQWLGRNVPQLAIWDDHDYGLNDHDHTSPVREPALQVFRRYWANPAYGLAEAPGVFFRYGYGAVDFFMLDGRYYRDPNHAPDVPGKTLLGAPQREWLQHELLASTAAFKILACGSGWTRAKGPGGDSWASFLHERDMLFDFIRARGIRGVVLISGDTHVGELNAVPYAERGGYDFYDLVSSPLAQGCDDSWLERKPEQRIRPVHFAGPNFGLMQFDFSAGPRLTYRLVDASGRDAWQPLELRADELRNGVSSWRDKADPHLLGT